MQLIIYLPKKYQEHVYGVRMGGPGGPIKVGYSSDPYRRIKSLQTASPQKLELLFIVPGGRDNERAFHDRFSHCRLNGEWFSTTPEMSTWIKEQFSLAAQWACRTGRTG